MVTRSPVHVCPAVASLRLLLALSVMGLAVDLRAHEGGHERPEQAAAPLLTDTGVDLSQPPRQPAADACEVQLRLIDKVSGQPVHGVIRISQQGRRVALANLLSRGTGLTPRSVGTHVFAHMNCWSILPGQATLRLPRAPLQIEFMRGPESKRGLVQLDLRNRNQAAQVLSVEPLHQSFSTQWLAGNPHLHLQQMSLQEAEHYACQTAAADGYDIVFFSYLERAEADQQYTSNLFTAADLNRFSELSGVLFGYGEEYRHNLLDHHEGYGHAMMLNLPRLILPASLGPSLTKSGNDDVPLRPGIQSARDQGATLLWCHGTRGLEDIPSWLAGLLDVQMIFDQGSLGTYEEAFYRYWDLGLPVPIATGTDWFFRDMARVLVRSETPLSQDSWLESLRRGQSFITNGPLIHLTVDGKPLGEHHQVNRGTPVNYHATVWSGYDFGALELVHDGAVISAPATRREGGFTAEIQGKLQPQDSTWIAARVTPFAADYDRPEATVGGHFNAYGKPIFAHTSPVFIHVDDQPVFRESAAHSLLAELRHSQQTLLAKGTYSSDQARDDVLNIYADAVAAIEQRLAAGTVPKK